MTPSRASRRAALKLKATIAARRGARRALADEYQIPRSQAHRMALGCGFSTTGLMGLTAALIDLRGVVTLVVAILTLVVGSSVMARAALNYDEDAS